MRRKKAAPRVGVKLGSVRARPVAGRPAVGLGNATGPERAAGSGNAGVPRDPARERLLEVAHELFSARGVDSVTVRELAEAAKVNVAGVNYYFGSKDGLLLVLFRREAKVLVEQRMKRLGEAECCEGPLTLRLELFVRALLEPVLRWCLQPRVRTLYVPTLQRAATRSHGDLQVIMERESENLQPFVAALGRMLPEIPPEEVYWRLHFLLGLEHSLIGDLPRLEQLSKGLCETTDIDRIISRIVAFALHGLVPETTASTVAAGRKVSPRSTIE
jgi:AcrR family transcriptional regulator